eukprot:311081_1
MAFSKQQFNQFCVRSYKNVLNDYIHFMTTHSAKIEKIYGQITKCFSCDISECNAYERCCRRTDSISNDNVYDFYGDLFDRFHQYMYHLFDIGIRISTNQINNIHNKDQHSETQHVDTIFAQQQRIILRKRHEYKKK